MTGKRWLVAIGLGVALAGSGCVSCSHQVCKTVLDAGPNCEVPLCDRRHLYTILVNGVTPGGPSGLEGLRDKLAGHGFEKVYYGQLYHVWWLWEEMKQVHKDDPSARFVIVGYDLSSYPVMGLARDAVKKKIPVDAVVLLDPSPKPDGGTTQVRTVMIRCTAGAVAPHADGIALPDATHLTLPTHPQTVDIVFGLLKESAMRVEHPPYYDMPEETYDGMPPRPMSVPPAGFPQWNFLYDQPGTHSIPLPPVPQDPMVLPAQPVSPPGGWFVPQPGDRQVLPQPRPLRQD